MKMYKILAHRETPLRMNRHSKTKSTILKIKKKIMLWAYCLWPTEEQDNEQDSGHQNHAI